MLSPQLTSFGEQWRVVHARLARLEVHVLRGVGGALLPVFALHATGVAVLDEVRPGLDDRSAELLVLLDEVVAAILAQWRPEHVEHITLVAHLVQVLRTPVVGVGLTQLVGEAIRGTVITFPRTISEKGRRACQAIVTDHVLESFPADFGVVDYKSKKTMNKSKQLT